MKYEKLEEIERETSGHMHGHQIALRKMLFEALSGLSLTWKDICDALRSQSVEEKVHAEKLEKKYCQYANVLNVYEQEVHNEGNTT